MSINQKINQTLAEILATTLTLLLTTLISSCGYDETNQSNPLIVGGTEVSISDVIAKSTVALVKPSGKTFCSGTLISSKFVVTASHCLAGYNGTLYIAFGLIAKKGHFSRSRLRKASRITVHEEFSMAAMRASDPTPPNDIALIKLESASPAGFSPVRTLNKTSRIQIGEKLILAGFGLTDMNGSGIGVLRKVDTVLASINSDKKEFNFGPTPGRTSCKGDSGGPAYVLRSGKIKLLGVTSRGDYCKTKGTYTDVRKFLDWLINTAAR